MALGPEGYEIYPEAITLWLSALMTDRIKASPKWHWLMESSWEDDLPRTFRYWLSGFLTDSGIRHHSVSDLVVFNRQPGDLGRRLHDDSDGNPNGTGRAFVACYFSPTTGGRGPLALIPGTQDGADTPLRQRCREARRVLENVTPKPSDELLAAYADMDGPQDGEMVVEVPARSIVVVREEVLHRALPNTSDGARPMCLAWIHLIT